MSVHRGVLSQHALQVVSQHALQQVSKWGGVSRPIPKGAWRGVWSRLTPKGEVDGDLPGGAWSQGVPDPGGACSRGGLVETPSSLRTATAAGGTHLTGMHSCLAELLPKTA